MKLALLPFVALFGIGCSHIPVDLHTSVKVVEESGGLLVGFSKDLSGFKG